MLQLCIINPLVPDHFSLSFQNFHHLVRFKTANNIILTCILHYGRSKIFSENVWGQLFVVVVCQNQDIRDYQANNNQRLKSNEPTQVINFGKSVTAGVVTVTQVMKDHHNYHKHGISHGQNVERSSSYILRANIEFQISLD